MKKIVFSLVAMLVMSAGSVSAQSEGSAQGNSEEKIIEKEERVLSKQELKALQESIDSMQWAEAVAAVRDTAFTLEADEVIFKYGQRAYVSSTTNFVAVDKNNATVQVAFNVPMAGPNGMGGVTLDGRVSNYKMSFDKKGTTMTLTMNVTGIGISSRLTISLYKGSNRAQVDVQPNFNSHRISLSGRLLPKSQSFTVKGRSL